MPVLGGHLHKQSVKPGTVCAYRTVGLPEMAGIITDASSDHPTVRQLLGQGVTVIPAA